MATSKPVSFHQPVGNAVRHLKDQLAVCRERKSFLYDSDDPATQAESLNRAQQHLVQIHSALSKSITGLRQLSEDWQLAINSMPSGGNKDAEHERYNDYGLADLLKSAQTELQEVTLQNNQAAQYLLQLQQQPGVPLPRHSLTKTNNLNRSSSVPLVDVTTISKVSPKPITTSWASPKISPTQPTKPVTPQPVPSIHLPNAPAASSPDLAQQFALMQQQIQQLQLQLAASAQNPVMPTQPTPLFAPVQRPKIKLRELDIPPWDGDPRTFKPWKSLVQGMLDADPPRTGFEKFTRLLGAINKNHPCYATLSRMEPTETGYKAAWQLLSSTFDNDDKRRDSIMDEILYAQAPTPTLQDMRAYYYQVKIAIEDLESLGVDFTSHASEFLLRAVRRNIPETIRHDVLRPFGATTTYTVKDLLDQFNQQLLYRERYEDDFATSTFTKPTQYKDNGTTRDKPPITSAFAVRFRPRSPSARQRSSFKGRQRSPFKRQRFDQRQQPKIRQPERQETQQRKESKPWRQKQQQKLSEKPATRPFVRKRDCIFCDGPHLDADCTKFSTAGARKKCLWNKDLCLICCRTGHLAANCPRSERTCRHCNKPGHAASCCGLKFPTVRFNTTNNVANSNIGAPPTDQLNTSTHVSNISKRSQSLYTPPVSVSVNTLTTSNHRSKDDHHDLHSLQVVPTNEPTQDNLLTAQMQIMNTKTNKTKIVQVLFDTASQRNWISETVAKNLDLPVIRNDQLNVEAFLQEPQEVDSDCVAFTLKSLDAGYTTSAHANVTERIALFRSLPSQLTSTDKSFLEKRDPDYHEVLADNYGMNPFNYQPDVLIGGRQFWTMMYPTGSIRLPSGADLLFTKVGLVLTAALPTNEYSTNYKAETRSPLKRARSQTARSVISEPLIVFERQQVNDIESDEQLRQFMTIESLGVSELSNESDEMARQLFANTVKFVNGRFSVSLPWRNKDDLQRLKSNYNIARAQFRQMTRSLQANPDAHKAATEIIQQQQLDNIIEPADDDPSAGYYLPWHMVVKAEHQTTKVRLVYNASSHGKGASSLNEELLRGDIRLPDLCAFLLKIRTKPILVCSDIARAFLQISVNEEDRDFLKFFWEDGVYRFSRVPFGVISSPWLLEAVLRYLTHDADPKTFGMHEEDSLVADIYVDNIASSVQPGKTIKYYEAMKTLFATASMQIRQFATNCPTLRDHIDKTAPADGTQLQTSLLGHIWKQDTDVIFFKGIDAKYLSPSSPPVTKRQLLAAVASCYDPTGYLIVLLLGLKLIYQDTWVTDSASWDGKLSEATCLEIQNELQSLTDIKELSLPRCVVETKPINYSLHVFSDASAAAYCSVVYFVANYANQTRTSQFLFARQRVTPSKMVKAAKKNPHDLDLTIPRLELLSIQLSSTICNFLIEKVNLKPVNICMYTDSMVALQQLTSTKAPSLFVRNRVRKIANELESLPCPVGIQHIDGPSNPADLGSRPGKVRVEQLNDKSHMWRIGPDFLINGSQPDTLHFTKEEVVKAVHTEKAPLVFTTTKANATELPEQTVLDVTKYSSWLRLCFVTSFILIFISRTMGILFQRMPFSFNIPDNLIPALTKTLPSAIHLRIVRQYWIRQAQKSKYSDIWTHFHSPKSRKPPKLIQQMNLYFDKDIQLIRVNHRLHKTSTELPSASPILLPPDHHITTLIVTDAHHKLSHAGTQMLLAYLRCEYWIPRGRQVLNTLRRKCTICRKHGGGPYRMPPFPNLPDIRIVQRRPFQFTGADFLGPLAYKNEAGHQKAYVLLLTCLTTRAVHLETTTSLTATAFLNAFKRFCYRRGVPKHLLTDNASTFMATKKYLDATGNKYNAPNKDLLTYFASEDIEWHTTIPHHPAQGGVYERLVALTKNALKLSYGRRRIFSMDDLITNVTAVEAMLNSRPLTYIPASSDDYRIIRPSDFLSPTGQTAICPPANDDDAEEDDPTYYSSTHYPDTTADLKRLDAISNARLKAVWHHWRLHYLQMLKERPITGHRQPRVLASFAPRIGHIVLIGDNTSPRGSWQIGKVTDLLCSSDNSVRGAKIRLSQGKEVERPLHMLYPFEIEPEANPTSSKNPKTTSRPMEGDKMAESREIAASNVPKNDSSSNTKNKTAQGSAQPRTSARLAAKPKINWTSLLNLVTLLFVSSSMISPVSSTNQTVPETLYWSATWQAPGNLTLSDLRRATEKAFTLWLRPNASQFQHRETQEHDPYNTLKVKWVNKTHGNCSPFTDEVLAHATANEIHINKEQPFFFKEAVQYNNRLSHFTKFDLQEVMLHEIGHILGVKHSKLLTSVMYPYSYRSSPSSTPHVITPHDRAQIQLHRLQVSDAEIFRQRRTQPIVDVLKGKSRQSCDVQLRPGEPAHVDNTTAVLALENCQHQGRIVYFNHSTQQLCSAHINCQDKLITTTGACQSKCDSCPKWSTGCTIQHFKIQLPVNNTETLSKVNQDQLLLQMKPQEICSLQQTPHCNAIISGPKDFHQIETTNGRKYLIDQLRIKFTDTYDSNYTCVKLNNTNLLIGANKYTGTKEFCTEHICSPIGNTYCFKQLRHIAYLQLANHKSIPVSSWGTIRTTYHSYHHPITPDCDSCIIVCHPQGIEVQNLPHEATVLTLDVTTHHIHSKLHLNMDKLKSNHLISQTKDLLIFPRTVRIKVWAQGKPLVDKTLKCPATDLCQLIDCTFCAEYWQNPQCYGVSTVVVLFSIPSFVLMVLLVLWHYTTNRWCPSMNTYQLLSRCYRNHRQRRHHRNRTAHVESTELLDFTGINVTNPEYIETRAGRSPTDESRQSSTIEGSIPMFAPLPASLFAIFMCLLCVHGATTSCPTVTTLTASENQCIQLENGQQRCSIQSSTRVVTHGTEGCIILSDSNSNPISTLHFHLTATQTCNRVDLYHTASSRYKVASSTRCGGVGQCTGTTCEETTTSTKSPELPVAANDALGRTYCAASCGCWACSCFTCTSACTFYRTYLTRTNSATWIAFRCPSLTTEMKATLTLTSQSSTLTESTTLLSGERQQFFNNTLTAVIVGYHLKPISTIPTQSYITNGDITAQLENISPVAAPQHNLVGAVQCPTAVDAANFSNKCIDDPLACQCDIQQTGVTCNCGSIDIEKIAHENALPQILPTYTILPHRQHGIHIKPQLEMVEFQVTTHDLIVYSKTTKLTTSVSILQIHGCYNCKLGALVIIHCRSNVQATPAYKCESGNTGYLTCQPSGTSASVKHRYNSHLVRDKCTVLSSKTTFDISGELCYTTFTSPYSSYIRVENDDLTQANPEGFNWASLSSALPFTLGNLRSILIVVTVVILVVLLGPLLVPCYTTLLSLCRGRM